MRKRASPLESAMKAVAAHSESLEKAESKMLMAQNASGLNRNKAAQMKLDGLVEKVAKFAPAPGGRGQGREAQGGSATCCGSCQSQEVGG